jgi:calpain
LFLENVNDVRLVRVRNPWGSKEEWKGKWADDDEKWNSVPEDVRKTLGLTLAPDGEFWMSFKDFIANFDDLMLGHLTPDSLSPMFFARSRQHILDKEKFEWQKKSIYGEWVRGATAGGHLDRMHTNPQFQVELKQLPGNPSDALCPLVISLMQMNRRKMLTTTTGKVDDLAISCFLYKPISNDLPRSSINKSYPRDGLNRIDYLQFSYQRENAKTFLLPPG